MKRHFLLGVSLCWIAWPLYAQELPASLPSGQAGAPFAEARLTQADGDVSVLTSSGDAQGHTVPGEMLLVEGDQVSVGSQGGAEISLDGLTLVHLEAGSTMRIKSLEAKNIVLGLDSGTLLAKVKFEKKLGASFSVETPTLVAAVRGTELVVQQEFAGARVGVLDEGHVLVTGRGSKEHVLLHFNQETDVHRGLPPEKPHHLQYLYHYKLEMSKMRDRIKYLRKHWYALTPEQRQMVRDAWVKTHPRIIPAPPPPVRKTPQKSHHHSHSAHTSPHSAAIKHESN
jgi:hypothetical protein